jgi:hypothetical protein
VAVKHNFKFLVDVNVINHLGVGLYSSTPAALTELVANAWDADATSVRIDVNPEERTISIEDDGHGMGATEIQGKFLNVGYSRRQTADGHMSQSGRRRVMGRKGIGKLAMFALADMVQVASQKSGGEAIGLKIDVPEFKKALSADKPEDKHKDLEEFKPDPFPRGKGTRLVLEKVLTGLNTTESHLRVRLARRFSVIEDRDFEVRLNGAEITRADRGFYGHVQMLWAFDDATRTAIAKLATNIAKVPDGKGKLHPCIATLSDSVFSDGDEYKITGYIASVAKPAQLGSRHESANVLSIFANGRVFAEDVLKESNSAKYYQNYLVGEIHADFLDSDSVDRATASREAIKKDDPKYQALLNQVRRILDTVGDQWDEWRVGLGLDQSDPGNATVLKWMEQLEDPRDRKLAGKFMTSIQNATIHADEARNEAAKKVLYRNAIVSFEKLRITKQLDKLEQVTDILSPEFAAIFAGLDQVEETAYAEITRQRLAVIRRFAEIADDPAVLEKVAQKFLFRNLWLLDPTWPREGGHAQMELTLTNYLKKKVPDSKGARLDISYRSSSGRHVVVELKKPGKKDLKFVDLYDQANRYRQAIDAYYEQHEPNKPKPALDVYLLVARTPTNFDEKMRQSLETINGKILPYAQLINDAKATYESYLATAATVGSLEDVLRELE